MGIIDLDGLEVRLGTRTVLNGLTGELQGNAIGLLYGDEAPFGLDGRTYFIGLQVTN